MKTNNKVGHNKNVSNAVILKSRVISFGDSYNPSNDALKVVNLDVLVSNGQAVNTAVDVVEVGIKNAKKARSTTFVGVNPLIDRSMNALKVSGASPQTIEQAKSLVREVHGRRASDILTDEELAAAKLEGKDIKQHVKRNASFDTRTESFGKYVLYMAAVPEYKPNEADITVEGLNTKYTDLKVKKDDILAATTTYETALAKRFVVLYADYTGLVDVAKNVKLYVKSAYGSSSSQYKQISNLKFIKFK